MEARKGSQTPTASFCLPYTQSHGGEAIEMYNLSGRTAMEWQELLAYDILAVDDDGLWVHSSFGMEVPRQNGKNEVVSLREMWGIRNGERILHTAHYAKTSTAAFIRLCKILEDCGIHQIKGKVTTGYRSGSSKGQEFIEMSKEYGSGRVEFRTRTATGGLGESFDVLIIDEAQEYRIEHKSALQYTIAASMNPQTIYTGTPPTAYSSGTIFPQYRKNVLSGEAEHAGWAEWSVDEMSDVHDRELWYLTNPSLGTLISERTIAEEIGDNEADFNIQRLGLWIKYNQKSEISRNEWDDCLVTRLPEFVGKMSIGIKASKIGTVSLSIALTTRDGRFFVESIGNKSLRNGVEWVVEFCQHIGDRAHAVVIDGSAIASTLTESLKRQKPIMPTIVEIIKANAQFEQMIVDKKIAHMDQPGLTQAITNCEKRAIGSNGGYGFASNREGVDISLMDSALLAVWGLTDIKPHKKMMISY